MTPRTLLAATLIALATLPSAQAAQRCVDFLAIPDNTPVPEKFKLAKFKFQDRSGGWAPFVNVFSDLLGQPVHGMQFDARGLRVTLPGGSLGVELRVGDFGGLGLQVQALDAAGGLQDAFLVPSDFLMHTITLSFSTAPITMVQIKGGADNGVLNSMCATR